MECFAGTDCLCGLFPVFKILEAYAFQGGMLGCCPRMPETMAGGLPVRNANQSMSSGFLCWWRCVFVVEDMFAISASFVGLPFACRRGGGTLPPAFQNDGVDTMGRVALLFSVPSAFPLVEDLCWIG